MLAGRPTGGGDSGVQLYIEGGCGRVLVVLEVLADPFGVQMKLQSGLK